MKSLKTRPPLHCQHLERIGPAQAPRQHQLQESLVAQVQVQSRRRRQPLLEFLATIVRQGIHLFVRPFRLVYDFVRDQAVAAQPIESGVDLPHVHGAGRHQVIEAGLQLISMKRLAGEEPEDGMLDGQENGLLTEWNVPIRYIYTVYSVVKQTRDTAGGLAKLRSSRRGAVSGGRLPCGGTDEGFWTNVDEEENAE